jgi:hypothetical protein
MKRACSLLASVMVLSAPMGSAQSSAPAALVESRREFEATAAEETALLNDLYQRALLGLQLNAAQDGDYEQALAAKQRRAELVAQSEALRRLAGADAGVELALSEARLAGRNELDSDAIVGWSSDLSSAEWIVNRMTPGRYILQLSYRWRKLASAVVTEPPTLLAREVSSLPGASANVVKCSLTLTGPGAGGRAKADGVITVSNLPFTLRLAPEEAYEDLELSLLGVTLVPVNSAGAAPTDLSAASLKPELDALLEAHREAVRTVRRPLLDDYVDKLNALLAGGAVGKKVVEAEMRRAKGALSADATSATALAASGRAGLTSLEDVRYMSDAQNTATRFKVQHEGQTFWIHLLWVTSPPHEPALDMKAFRFARDRFRLDELEAVALGQAAKEFTELYLSGRPLKVLARAAPAEDGTVSALLYVEPVGLFQHVLVDHGLAVVDPGGVNKRSVLETSILGSLQERESRARGGDPAEGGWAK